MSVNHQKYAREHLAARQQAIDERGRMCEDCGFPGYVEAHHIVPLHRGGSLSVGNIRLLCRTCHLEKHGRVLTTGERAWRRMTRELQ